jgi:hypothetical protein
MFIPDPGSWIWIVSHPVNRIRISDPGVKKTPDPGSATLFNRLTEFSMKDVETACGIWFKKWKCSQIVDVAIFSLFYLFFYFKFP